MELSSHKPKYSRHLFALGPPDPPGGKPTVCEVKADSVTLTWYGSVYDGGSVITGYLVEVCQQDLGQWDVLTSE